MPTKKGDDNDGQDHPETDVGVKQQLRPRHLLRVGSRPSVTGFLFVGTTGPSWGRLWSLLTALSQVSPGPTAASSLSPAPSRAAGAPTSGADILRHGEGALQWRQRGVVPGGKLEEEGQRRLLRWWVGQRSSSLEPRYLTAWFLSPAELALSLWASVPSTSASLIV